MASGIALSHIVAVIDRHLTDHRRRYNSGSGDALFSWLAEHVRRTWDKRTSLHHGPNQPEQRCHELQITNGSIGNQALTPQSISGVALPFEKRLWAIGHMPLGTVELIRRLPRVQRRLAKSEEGQSRSTEPWPSCVASSQMARSPQPAWRKGQRLAVYPREHSIEPVLGSRSFHDAPASLRMGNAWLSLPMAPSGGAQDAKKAQTRKRVSRQLLGDGL